MSSSAFVRKVFTLMNILYTFKHKKKYQLVFVTCSTFQQYCLVCNICQSHRRKFLWFLFNVRHSPSVKQSLLISAAAYRHVCSVRARHSESRVDETREIILPHSVRTNVHKAIPCCMHGLHFILNFIQFVSLLWFLFLLILFKEFNVRLCGLRRRENCASVSISW